MKWFAPVLLCLLPTPSAAGPAEPPPGAMESILQAFVEDFRSDPAADTALTFGIQIKDEGEWYVVVTPSDNPEVKTGVELYSGPPPQPSMVFVTDAETLRRIHHGKLNALTAMGKARSSDFAPLDLEMIGITELKTMKEE